MLEAVEQTGGQRDTQENVKHHEVEVFPTGSTDNVTLGREALKAGEENQEWREQGKKHDEGKLWEEGLQDSLQRRADNRQFMSKIVQDKRGK